MLASVAVECDDVVAAPGISNTGSVVASLRLICSKACGIFPVRDRTRVSCMQVDSLH